MKKNYLFIALISLSNFVTAQTLYVPSGTVGTSTNTNVGIGTSTPTHKLDVKGPGWFSNGSVLDIALTTPGGKNGIAFNASGYPNYSRFDISNHDNTTSGNRYFRFRYNQDVSGLTIRKGGFIGIGTVSPSVQLEVYKQTGTEVVAQFRTPEGSINIAAAGNSIGNSTYGNYISSRNSTNTAYKDLGLKTTGGVPQFMIKTNGNVGIGTDSPTSKLDVFRNSGNEAVATFRTNEGTVHIAAAGPSTENPTYSNYISSRNASNTAYEDFAIKTGSGIGQLLVKTNGSVGINTTTTGTHKLAVHGSIGAREIKVEASGWSDFVFEKDYNLRTLEEVEKHINENGHLRAIPSEAEVAENGINLGEMDAKLLQKIEELTLYMIDMNKRMGQLEEENGKLKREISTLKKE